jgi:hypothetical protein
MLTDHHRFDRSGLQRELVQNLDAPATAGILLDYLTTIARNVSCAHSLKQHWMVHFQADNCHEQRTYQKSLGQAVARAIVYVWDSYEATSDE